MASDPEQRYQALTRFCRATRAGDDPRTLFRHAADAIHGITECDRVSVFFAADGPFGGSGFAVDFAGVPSDSELSMEDRPPAAHWVLEHQQPRIVPGPDATAPDVLYLPLLCHGTAV